MNRLSSHRMVSMLVFVVILVFVMAGVSIAASSRDARAPGKRQPTTTTTPTTQFPAPTNLQTQPMQTVTPTNQNYTINPITTLTVKIQQNNMMFSQGPVTIRGKCPMTLKPQGIIGVNGKASVDYEWWWLRQSSQGTQGPNALPPGIATHNFAAAGMKMVSNNFINPGWSQGEETGWVELRVHHPVKKVSNRVKFTIICE